MRPHSQAPNGVFAENLLLYGALERGGVAARGVWVTPPDLRGASHEQRNAFQEKLRAMLALLTPGRRMQVQWWTDADYRSELLAYDEGTQLTNALPVRRARNERTSRYVQRMRGRKLRRDRLAVFLSTEIAESAGNFRTRGGIATHYREALTQVQAQFEEWIGALRAIFGAETPVRAMNDAEHFRCLHEFLNPGAISEALTFDPVLTIQENVWHADGVGQPEGGFVLGGHHHAVLALCRWPRATYPGIVSHLTSAGIPDYRITVNVMPGESRREIRREEQAMERLQGEYADTRRHSLAVALQKKERKIESLAGGFARPFQVTYLVRVWDTTRDGVREKVALLRKAIRDMNGAQCFECALPVSAKKLFFASWPGWTHSAYAAQSYYAEDSYLADLLPFAATFTGRLDRPEAIYDGSHDNLVGVSTEANGSPQHAVLIGMTGAGKSEFMHDLLLQTAPFFGHTLLVEEGLSYRRFTEAMGEKPIIVQPDAMLTLNYLDTQRLPLTQLHVASAVALVSRMVGEPEDPEKAALRQAQLAQYLHQLYADTFADWSRRQPEQARFAAKFACTAERWRQRMGPDATPLEAFADLRERRETNDGAALEFWNQIGEADVTRFCQDPATAKLVPRAACAFWTPEDFPTHSALVELMAFGRFAEHAKEEIDRLATLLRAWTAQGQYGRLFDGTTTISLDRPVVHFELGLIPEQATELKAAAGLLISGFARQHLLSLPRSVRKRIVFEELARFLNVRGGEQIVAEGYAQLRKFNCWVVSIVQQYALFRSSRVRSAVIGNAKQFFLMRQADRSDLAELARDLALPESAVEAIQNYPLPEQLPTGARHSSLCYFLPTTQPPQCGTIRHIAPLETDANTLAA